MSEIEIKYEQINTVCNTYVVIVNDEMAQERYGKNATELTREEVHECAFSDWGHELVHEEVVDTQGAEDIRMSYHNNKGECHRDNGPAVINADGTEEYWVRNKQIR